MVQRRPHVPDPRMRTTQGSMCVNKTRVDGDGATQELDPALRVASVDQPPSVEFERPNALGLVGKGAGKQRAVVSPVRVT